MGGGRGSWGGMGNGDGGFGVGDGLWDEMDGMDGGHGIGGRVWGWVVGRGGGCRMDGVGRWDGGNRLEKWDGRSGDLEMGWDGMG